MLNVLRRAFLPACTPSRLSPGCNSELTSCHRSALRLPPCHSFHRVISPPSCIPPFQTTPLTPPPSKGTSGDACLGDAWRCVSAPAVGAWHVGRWTAGDAVGYKACAAATAASGDMRRRLSGEAQRRGPDGVCLVPLPYSRCGRVEPYAPRLVPPRALRPWTSRRRRTRSPTIFLTRRRRSR
jgi:hypothetical protein